MNERMDGRTTRHVSLSVVPFRSVHPMGGRIAMLHRNLRGRGKNPASTNKYTKFGHSIIRKIIKITATRCHILRLKCTKFYTWDAVTSVNLNISMVRYLRRHLVCIYDIVYMNKNGGCSCADRVNDVDGHLFFDKVKSLGIDSCLY